MTPETSDRIATLRQQLLGTEQAVPTSGLSRLWRTGRGAAGLAVQMLSGRLGGKDKEMGDDDLDAIGRLVAQLGELKGVSMKAGQILGYVDPAMKEELRGMLSLLQTSAAATPLSQVTEIIRQELGPAAAGLLAGLEPAPVAVASIGQVHRAVLEDGTLAAVKVRHPGIEQALRQDFRAASVAPAMAAVFAGGLGGTVRGFVDEARTAMLEECDFEQEARRQAQFGRLYQADPAIVVPAVLPALCAPAVLTTRWEAGRSLDDLLAQGPRQELRDRLGTALFNFYIGSLYRHGLYHADPHPGNYAFRDSGEVVVYDFGCVRTFERSDVRAFASLVAAVRRDDPRAIREAIEQLGGSPPSGEQAQAHLRGLLRGFFAPLLLTGPRPVAPGAGVAAREAIRDKRAIMQLALPGKLLFLFRLRFGLYAVLSRLGAVADWSAMESAWAGEALGRS